MSKSTEYEPDEFERLMTLVDNEYDKLARRLYNDWQNLGEANYRKDSHMLRALKKGIFWALFEHFESTEEYEICTELQEMKWRILAFKH